MKNTIAQIIVALVGAALIAVGIYLLAEFIFAFAKIFVGMLLIMIGFGLLFGTGISIMFRK